MEMSPLVLVFDTETTGLPPKMGKDRKHHDAAEKKLEEDPTESEPLWASVIAQWPVTIQFSYIIYNLATNQYSMYNKYVEDMPAGMAEAFLADPSTHYTVKGALEKRQEQIAKKAAGEPNLMATRREIMEQFMRDLNQDITLVAHNLKYDYKMVLAELYRLQLESGDGAFFRTHGSVLGSKPQYCTMCKAQKEKKALIKARGQYGLWDKPPKLEELYNKFFGYMPISDNLHNSLIDSIVTLRCFYRLANSPPKIALCGVGAPDVYLVAGEPMGPVEKTLQEYIQQDITPAGTDPNGVGGPVAPCVETILGGRRRRKTSKRSRRNNNRKTHRRLKRKSMRKH
jgi:DNA polymerase III epsilon subunit-like protein